MKNRKKMDKMFGGFVVMAGLLAGWVTCAAAGSDMEAMLAEGIAYKSPAVEHRASIARESVSENVEAAMAEGIAYRDSGIADDVLVVKIDHRLVCRESMESLLCEDGPDSIGSMIASYQKDALAVMPAAGKME